MARIVKPRVRQTSTTTGTGPFTLEATPPGFQPFSTECSVGDTFAGVIANSDGEWQEGLFRYSAANQISTVEVHESSNADSAVTFGAGEKDIFIGITSRFVGREKLLAARTYYVRTDGNDNNTGRDNTATEAFLTIQKAVDTIQDTLDTNGYDVTIQVADGTYSGGVVFGPKVGAGIIYLTGNAATPANCIISTTSNDCIRAVRAGYNVPISGFRLLTTTSGRCIRAGYWSTFTLAGAIEFGACANEHLYVDNGGIIFVNANYSVIGSAAYHLRAESHGSIYCSGRTITVSASLTFTHFALSQHHGLITVSSTTYSNTTATGTRHLADRLGLIHWGGTPVTFPGSVSGSATNGGITA